MLEQKLNFKVTRKALGLSKKELGHCLGVSKSIINLWESPECWLTPTNEAMAWLELAMAHKEIYESNHIPYI